MHEINVPLPDGPITADTLPAIRAAFATAYAARYTSVYGGVGVQAISFRVRCRGPLPALSLTEAGGGAAGAARKGTRPAWFGDGFVETPVYDRYALARGTRDRRPRHHRGTRGHDGHRARRPGDRRCQPAALRIAIGLRRRAGRAHHRRYAAGAGRRADRSRSGLARDHVEPTRHRGRGDVADDLPHRVQPDRLGGAGLRLRPAGCRRRVAGAFAARHAGVQPDAAARGAGAAARNSRPRRCSPATC